MSEARDRDGERRRRRREKQRDEEEYESRRSTTRPSLTSQSYHDPRSSGKERNPDSPDSMEAQSGKKGSVRFSDDPKKPTTPSGVSRPAAPTRPSKFDNRDGQWKWPPESRDDQEVRRSRDDPNQSTYGYTGSSRRRKDDDYERREEDRERRDIGDSRPKTSRRSSRREDRYDDGDEDRLPPSSRHRPERDSRDSYASTSGRRPSDEEYGKSRKQSYDSRRDSGPPPDRIATQGQLTLPLRPSGQEPFPVEGDASRRSSMTKTSLKRPPPQKLGSFDDRSVNMTESDRLTSLANWRTKQLRMKYDLYDKLRGDLKTAFTRSADSQGRGRNDKSWLDAYKWDFTDALDTYRTGRDGLNVACGTFERDYKETVDRIYDRYVKYPSKGVPREGAETIVEGQVTAEEKRDGLFIKSSYTFEVDGNKEARDDFHQWFPSKRASDSVKAAYKDVKKGVLDALF